MATPTTTPPQSTTLKDKITYITITPTPSSPTSSIRSSSRASSFSSTTHGTEKSPQLDYPFTYTDARSTHENDHQHIHDISSPTILLRRRRRSRLLRKIRNAIVTVISLAVVFGLCSTGWWVRGVYDNYYYYSSSSPSPAAVSAAALSESTLSPSNSTLAEIGLDGNVTVIAPLQNKPGLVTATTSSSSSSGASANEEGKEAEAYVLEPVKPSPQTFPEIVKAATEALEVAEAAKKESTMEDAIAAADSGVDSDAPELATWRGFGDDVSVGSGDEGVVGSDAVSVNASSAHETLGGDAVVVAVAGDDDGETRSSWWL